MKTVVDDSVNGEHAPQRRQTSVYRQVVMDPKRHRFHNKAALILTVATLVLMLTLSILFGESDTSEMTRALPGSQPIDWSWKRMLEDGDNNNDDGGNNNGDYSEYSCRYLYRMTPDPGYAQCRFAKTCNSGDGVWAAWIFCNHKWFSTKVLFWMLSPIMLIWMVTLFRLLGSTAEDYFSPSLEMFSVKLGLPPRFAGVSLLALGNGAADVSATMSAIANDEENGYKLSLGALSGASMLVGGVVAGVVVLVAGGVPCRGALVRDVMALFVTIVVVWSRLRSGVVGPSTTTLFLSLYGVFVCLVLVADVYHRAVVLPRLQAVADNQEVQRQLDEERMVQNAASTGGSGVGSLAGTNDGNDGVTIQPETPNPPLDSSSATVDPAAAGTGGTLPPSTAVAPRSAMSRFITALSNYDNPTTDRANETGTGWGIDSSQLEQDTPIVLHGQHGILHGDGAVPGRTNDTGTSSTTPDIDGAGAYTLVSDDMIDQICVDGASDGFSASNWKGAWHDGKQDVIRHAQEVWEDIAWNGDVTPLEKFLLICEFPFTVMRKSTVPIPVEGYYNRGVVALATVVSPVWFAYYLWNGHDINLLSGDSWFFFLIFWLISAFVAAMVLRYAPGGDGSMAMGVAAPLALYGFIIAATWIDYVADNLVSLLDFIGIVLHIPGAIMGLTVLAWGNSMGDLSANMTMARKGLANMAMTACFAGPVFNILIGLGLGFSSLASKTGHSETSVSLNAAVKTGFLFVLLNCISILATGLYFGRGRIESYYGYTALALYTLYIISSMTLQFSKIGS